MTAALRLLHACQTQEAIQRWRQSEKSLSWGNTAFFKEIKNQTKIVKAIKKVQLSHNIVTRRCEGMAVLVEKQLRNGIDTCECFFLQFHQSTDEMDVAQLCLFTRMVLKTWMTFLAMSSEPPPPPSARSPTKMGNYFSFPTQTSICFVSD